MKDKLSFYGLILALTSLVSGLIYWIFYLPISAYCPGDFITIKEYFPKGIAILFWVFLPIIGLPVSYFGKKGWIRTTGFVLSLFSLFLFVLSQTDSSYIFC